MKLDNSITRIAGILTIVSVIIYLITVDFNSIKTMTFSILLRALIAGVWAYLVFILIGKLIDRKTRELNSEVATLKENLYLIHWWLKDRNSKLTQSQRNTERYDMKIYLLRRQLLTDDQIDEIVFEFYPKED